MSTRSDCCGHPSCWCDPHGTTIDAVKSASWLASLGMFVAVAAHFALLYFEHRAAGTVLLAMSCSVLIPLFYANWGRASVDSRSRTISLWTWFGLRERRTPFEAVDSVHVYQRRWLGAVWSRVVVRCTNGNDIAFQESMGSPFVATQLGYQIARAVDRPRIVHWVSGYETTVPGSSPAGRSVPSEV